MASSSSSPPSTSILPPRSCTYHAFLSFRGEDTRNGFTGHLYDALVWKGIKTFRDDNDLERGEVISVELLKAIEESMFAIIVLSPNYASSSWCLDELHKIVECSKSQGLSIVPIFYGVEPSDVRHQKGKFEEAFKDHEKRFAQDIEKVKRWRGALTEVANHSGWDSKVDKHEATLVKSIADDIHKKLIPKLPSSTKNLVGIASRVEEVMRHIGRGLNDVRFISIWGMGGIGKTTIARAVYEAIREEFQVSCFLAKVRETRETNGIVGIQKELVRQLNMSADTVYNEYDGQIIIQNSLCNKKVLLVLDDVSDDDELKNLAGDQDWFGPGSRIIITTRDIQLLKIYEVHGTYEVQGLVDDESLDLFCLKAFKQKKPNKKYLNLAKDVVKYSGGLPLALEVLGSHLCGRSDDVWRDAIEKIKSTPFAKIHDALKISYDNLDVMEKNIFLDMACFFEGWNTDLVTKVLEICGYNARIGIDILIDRSLIKINEWSNMFEMHDLLKDMGRSIVIQESPNPHERSRLWLRKDTHLVIADNKGSKTIQGIVLPPVSGQHWSPETFSNMTQLKFLIIWMAAGLHDLSNLPTSLKILHWWFYPLKALPLSNQQYELVEISLKHSEIENLWHGKKFLGKLNYLDLSGSRQLKQTPDLSGVPILQTLALENCWRLTKVHRSVVNHKSLTLLDLTGCRMLKSLPGKLHMRSLNELILDECSSLENLPEFGKCMKNLSRLSLERTSIKELPTSIHELPKLKCLKLNDCNELRSLPELPSSMRELEAWHCQSLDISEFNILSNMCGVFVSTSQDPSQVLLEMVISRSEIPSWFVHRQDGNSISIPCDPPPNERLGLALCFQLAWYEGKPRLKFDMVVRDGNNRFDTDSTTPMSAMVVRYGKNRFNTNGTTPTDKHLYIICLTNDYFSDGFHQGTCFELSSLDSYFGRAVSVTSAARWLSKEDIEDLKKSEIERPQKEHKKKFDLNKSRAVRKWNNKIQRCLKLI